MRQLIADSWIGYESAIALVFRFMRINQAEKTRQAHAHILMEDQYDRGNLNKILAREKLWNPVP